jgi:hypothetical protein
MRVPESINEDCEKPVKSVTSTVGVKITALKAFHVKLKIEEKSRIMMAEFQSIQSKRTMMENARKLKLNGKSMKTLARVMIKCT